MKSAARLLFFLFFVSIAFGAPVLAQEPLQASDVINDSTPFVTYTVDLTAGDVVTITTEATSGTLDTVLSLIDPLGRTVATNDDRGDGSYDSQIVYTVGDGGTYTIRVERYDDSTRGEFTLTLVYGAPTADPVAFQGGGGTQALQDQGTLDDTIKSESFEFDLERGDVVTITTEALSGSLDTVLYLYDPSGTEIANNDDRGDGTFNSQIVYTASVGGTYNVEVTRFDDTSEGTYSITVDIQGAGGGQQGDGTTTPASEEAQVFSGTGTISDSIPTDTWELPLDAGTVVVIDVSKTSGDLDTTITLLGPNGNEVGFNDDRGDGTYNSELVYEVAEGGTYSVVVSRYDESTSGDYEIVVSIDPNATPDFSFVDVEGSVLAQGTGSITRQADEFEYEVQLQAGQNVYASVEATSGDLDTILTLYAPDGQLVAVNDDRGDGTLNSALGYTAETSGTYTFVVARYDGGTSSGSFAFIAQLVDQQVVEQIEDTSDQAISLTGPVEIIETNHFRIYYTFDGDDATTEEYVRAFAETLEEMYELQINQIGWNAPPTGDDGLYDAYLADVIGTEQGALGYARPLSVLGDNPDTALVEERSADSVLVVDNDYYLPGADANPQTLMRATTTHEFNHMIQFGYDYDEALFWAFEATAVWTETVTVGDEQDATGYIGNNNEYPELCFATSEQDGSLAYGDWTLLEVMADRFGEGIVIRMWENAVEYEGLDILTQTLEEVGSSLPEMIAVWRAQNLAMDYDLGELFPRAVWIENTIDDFGSWSFQGSGVQEMGANYFVLDLDGTVDVELNGAGDLELWVIGIAGDEADAFNLASGGTVDLTRYSSSFAMVVNREQPRDIDACSYADYTLDIGSGSGTALTTPTLVFNAANFQRPQ